MDSLSTLWDNFSGSIPNILPRSPFTNVIYSLQSLPYIDNLNWFFPVGDCLQVLFWWLIAYGVYLAAIVILRWCKVVGQ